MKRNTIQKQAPLTYYGGKRRMIGYIMPLIPGHRIYCEPFFGGGAIFFAKKPSYLEVINDINDNLIIFYQVCQEQYDLLKKLIDNTIYSESLYNWAQLVYHGQISTDKLHKALAVFIVFNMAGFSNPTQCWSFDNGTGGSHKGVIYAHKRDSFCPWLKERLRYAQISCRDALKVIQERDSESTFFYLDPPYPGANQGHYKGYTETMLQELLELLTTIKGKFLLSNYFSELIAYYAKEKNWQLKVIEMKSDILNRSGRFQKKEEILLMNYKVSSISELNIFQEI